MRFENYGSGGPPAGSLPQGSECLRSQLLTGRVSDLVDDPAWSRLRRISSSGLVVRRCVRPDRGLATRGFLAL